MTKWQERLAALGAHSESCADSAVSADSFPIRAPEAPIGTNGTNSTAPLPPPLREGLERLAAMPAPRITVARVWPEIVADAQRLASDGWAHQALALGWQPLQLFGCSPVANAKGAFEGLLVWLGGRRIVLFDESCCVVVDGAHARGVFTRRNTDGARFLWEVGRGR